MEKKLYRSNKEKKLAGVCGGIAEYANIDPTVIRLIWALCCLAGGVGLIAYIVAIVIMPEQPAEGDANDPEIPSSNKENSSSSTDDANEGNRTSDDPANNTESL